jgi:SAM-dependent methyltransferase
MPPDVASASVPQGTGHHVPPVHLQPPLDLPAVMRILPWITDAATDHIETTIGELRKLGTPINAIECGSGSSTGYLAQRVAKLVSFDHAGDWHAAIKGAVEAIGIKSVEWRTAERPYWRFFIDYEDASFDIALVDGRDRTGCVEHVRRLLKPGGILVVDNTERIGGIDGSGPYKDMLAHVEGWHAIHFEQPWKDRAGWMPPHRWITSVWHKPSASGPIHYTTLGLPL